MRTRTDSPRTIAVVAPSMQNNSLGRAMVLVEVAEQLADEVHLFVHDDGPLWPGARDRGLDIVSVASRSDLEARLTSVATDHDSVVWILKPWAQSADWVRRWQLAHPDAECWFDEDDHDEAVHSDWLETLDAVRRSAHRVAHERAPWRIRRRLAWWGKRADLLTSSSYSLAGAIGWPEDRLVRVPHVRKVAPEQPVSSRDGIHIGFLGTPKSYKGTSEIRRVLDWIPDAHLHVFGGTESAFDLGFEQSRRVTTHPGDVAGAVERAMRDVDVVVLPQDSEAVAARFQLPAKLIDAIQFGRPVIASRTPTIEEFAGEGIRLLDAWDNRGQVVEAIEAWRPTPVRIAAATQLRHQFLSTLTAEAAAQAIREARSRSNAT